MRRQRARCGRITTRMPRDRSASIQIAALRRSSSPARPWPIGRTSPPALAAAQNVSTSPISATTALSRQRVTIYQVAIPPPGSTATVAAHAFHATYPDTPHDAEALLVTRDATFIITKDVPPRVYRFQSPARRGETGQLSLVQVLKETFRITAAAVSPDGRWIALRSNGTLLVYTNDGFLKRGNPVRVDLSLIAQRAARRRPDVWTRRRSLSRQRRSRQGRGGDADARSLRLH